MTSSYDIWLAEHQSARVFEIRAVSAVTITSLEDLEEDTIEH